MTDKEIKAVHRMLKGNYSFNTVLMPAPGCILFRAVPLRFGPGWIRVRQETYPCHGPEDVLPALVAAGLIRPQAADFLMKQLPFHIKQINKHQK
jgi:hypothetical protein